jgi:DNA-binding NarL/FixJ family response regulator
VNWFDNCQWTLSLIQVCQKMDHAAELLAAPSAGVGHMLKQRIADIPTFCADLERVCGGGTVLDPEVVALIVARARRENNGLSQLTDRQLHVLALMAEGRSHASNCQEPPLRSSWRRDRDEPSP